jgi:hypothetical protein
VPRHGPKNRGSWDPHLGQTARAGRPEAGPKVTPPTTQAKNRSLYMFGDRYPLQEIKAWLARASIRTAIKPTRLRPPWHRRPAAMAHRPRWRRPRGRPAASAGTLRRAIKGLVDRGEILASGNGGPGDPRRYTTVECFASATGETVKDTAHAKAIVAEMSDALSKMSKLGASK